MSDPVSNEPNSLHLSAEGDDLVTTSESFGEGSNSLEKSSNVVISAIDEVLTVVCHKYDIEKQQVYLGVVLICFLFIVVSSISLAWAYYSPIIQSFSLNEERARKASEKEKEKKKDE